MLASLDHSSMMSVGLDMLAAVEQDIESLDCIKMCALAQERIANGGFASHDNNIDFFKLETDAFIILLDILGLGQLGLDVFHVSATRIDLEQEVRKKLKIFDTETRALDINLNLVRDESLDRLRIFEVLADPVRLGQIMYVLIFLISINCFA